MESKFVSENTFNNWNTLKEQLDSRKNPPFVNEREICFLCIGKNIGWEQNGKNARFQRPVMVLKKFWKHSFVWIPLTSREKFGSLYYAFPFREKTSTAILSQIRLFDTRRVERKIGYIRIEDFQKIKKCLVQILWLWA